jgi:hypothetical protein
MVTAAYDLPGITEIVLHRSGERIQLFLRTRKIRCIETLQELLGLGICDLLGFKEGVYHQRIDDNTPLLLISFTVPKHGTQNTSG